MSVYLQQEDLRFTLQPRSHTDLPLDDAMLRTHSSFESASLYQHRPRPRSSDVNFYSIRPQGIAGNLTKGLVFWTRAELIHQSAKAGKDYDTSRRESHYENSTPIRPYRSNSQRYSSQLRQNSTAPAFTNLEYDGRF